MKEKVKQKPKKKKSEDCGEETCNYKMLSCNSMPLTCTLKRLRSFVLVSVLHSKSSCPTRGWPYLREKLDGGRHDVDRDACLRK